MLIESVWHKVDKRTSVTKRSGSWSQEKVRKPSFFFAVLSASWAFAKETDKSGYGLFGLLSS